MVLAVLRTRWGAGGGRAKFGGLLYDAAVPGPDGRTRRVMLFAPQLYMNRSGEAVKGLLEFYEAQPSQVLIVLDDMALPSGHLRARASGSGGGHNGLENVLKLMETHDIPRLRIGIDAAPPEIDAADYVLARFDAPQLERIEPAIERAANAVEDWIAFDIMYVMDKYNRKTERPTGDPHET